MIGVFRATLATTVLMVLLVLVFFVQPAVAQGEQASLRFAHLSPDAPSVDVYLNDEPVADLNSLTYQTVSGYLALPAGTQNVKIYPAGDDSEPVAEADLEMGVGSSFTVGVVGLEEKGSLKAQVYEDDTALPAGGGVKLRAVHAAPDVSSVDIAPEDGEDLFVDLGFPNATSYAEIPAGTYTLMARLTDSGKDAFVVPDAPLLGGNVYTAFAVGQAERGEIEVILAGDVGSLGGNRVVVPATPMPETGGLPPATLLAGVGAVAVSLVVAVAFGARGVARGTE